MMDVRRSTNWTTGTLRTKATAYVATGIWVSKVLLPLEASHSDIVGTRGAGEYVFGGITKLTNPVIS